MAVMVESSVIVQAREETEPCKSDVSGAPPAVSDIVDSPAESIHSREAGSTDRQFAWLDLTRRCNLGCEHCYIDAGIQGTHGEMTETDWERVIDDAPAAGIDTIQFIGGEPMLHPSLPRLLERARDRGISTQVYSNLTYVRPRMWEVLESTSTSLLTSWYSTEPDVHESITHGKGSHAKTLGNIQEALARGIPLSVGIVEVDDRQDVAAAKQMMLDLGVPEEAITVDRMREIGRGQRSEQVNKVSELCGACTSNVVVVTPTGDVAPCIMSTDRVAGNVLVRSLTDIASNGLPEVRQELDDEFAKIDPKACNPGMNCPPRCPPASCPPLRAS